MPNKGERRTNGRVTSVCRCCLRALYCVYVLFFSSSKVVHSIVKCLIAYYRASGARGHIHFRVQVIKKAPNSVSYSHKASALPSPPVPSSCRFCYCSIPLSPFTRYVLVVLYGAHHFYRSCFSCSFCVDGIVFN